MRKPPSVVLAAISLDAGPVQSSLIDEVISVANAIRNRLRQKVTKRRTVEVRNPAYTPDVFTDRWPENEQAQDLFDADLRRLTIELYRLRNEDLSMTVKTEILKKLFGETAANYAIESNLDVRRHEMETGRLHAGTKGKIAASVAAAAVTGLRTSPVRAATREGGGFLKE
jgi:hypothetical protein